MVRLCEKCLKENIIGLILAEGAIVIKREITPMGKSTLYLLTETDKMQSKCEHCRVGYPTLFNVETLAEAVDKRL